MSHDCKSRVNQKEKNRRFRTCSHITGCGHGWRGCARQPRTGMWCANIRACSAAVLPRFSKTLIPISSIPCKNLMWPSIKLMGWCALVEHLWRVASCQRCHWLSLHLKITTETLYYVFPIHEKHVSYFLLCLNHRNSSLHNSMITQILFSSITWIFPQPKKADKTISQSDLPLPSPIR